MRLSLVFLLLLISSGLSIAGDVIFNEDFQQKSPVEFWTETGKHTINYMGTTSENAQPGRTVFKLDISIEKETWGYYYFEIPCKFAPKDNIKFKTRLLIGKESTANVSFGFNLSYPSVNKTACSAMFKPINTTNGKWMDINQDATSWLEKHNNGIINRYCSLAQPDNLTPLVDRIGIFIFGTPKTKRMVIYLDGVTLTGDTYPLNNYKNIRAKRWQPLINRQQQYIEEFKTALATYQDKMGTNTALGCSSSELLNRLETESQSKGDRFIIDLAEYKQLKGWIADMKVVASIKPGSKSIVYVLNNPIISQMVLSGEPMPTSAKVKSSGSIKLIAAKDEFESVSIIVKALQNLTNVTLTCENLKQVDGSGVIASENIDIKIVKPWYQSGSAWFSLHQVNHRVLVPELLLNDDSLVKVDAKEKTNYLKLKFDNGEKYWNVDDPKYNKKKGTTILSIKDFPFNDSPTLMPLDIEAEKLKQFWITVNVPKSAIAGVYEGNLDVIDENGSIADFKLKLRVLPFVLPKPRTRYDLEREYVTSIYYRSRYDLKHPEGTLTSTKRSLQQISAEFKNMREHNIYNPNCYQSLMGDKESLGKILKLRNQYGMKGMPLYSIGFITTPAWEDKTERLHDKFTNVLSVMKEYDVPQLYVYGLDEARGDRLRKQLNLWKDIRSWGIKIFTAGTMQIVDDIDDAVDLHVLSGNPERSKAKKWREKNSNLQLFAYACPQGGVEDPELNRRGLGLLPWLADYDGIMTYAYMHSMGNVFNDFDHSVYRDHNYVYPTVNGVISTIEFAGLREGIDDTRYATVLLRLIDENRDGDKGALAIEAEQYMDSITSDGDLRLTRLEMIKYIMKLLN